MSENNVQSHLNSFIMDWPVLSQMAVTKTDKQRVSFLKRAFFLSGIFFVGEACLLTSKERFAMSGFGATLDDVWEFAQRKAGISLEVGAYSWWKMPERFPDSKGAAFQLREYYVTSGKRPSPEDFKKKVKLILNVLEKHKLQTSADVIKGKATLTAKEWKLLQENDVLWNMHHFWKEQ